jgi:hypothetical protein
VVVVLVAAAPGAGFDGPAPMPGSVVVEVVPAGIAPCCIAGEVVLAAAAA